MDTKCNNRSYIHLLLAIQTEITHKKTIKWYTPKFIIHILKATAKKKKNLVSILCSQAPTVLLTKKSLKNKKLEKYMTLLVDWLTTIMPRLYHSPFLKWLNIIFKLAPNVPSIYNPVCKCLTLNWRYVKNVCPDNKVLIQFMSSISYHNWYWEPHQI